MIENKTAEEAIELIKGRIMDEYRKHQTLDWSNIAARKIHSQWFEYYNQQNQELQRQVDGLKDEKHELKNEVYELNKTIKYYIDLHFNSVSQHTQLKEAADENKEYLIEITLTDNLEEAKEFAKKSLNNYKQLTQNQNG